MVLKIAALLSTEDSSIAICSTQDSRNVIVKVNIAEMSSYQENRIAIYWRCHYQR